MSTTAAPLKPGLRKVRLDKLRPSDDNPRTIAKPDLERLMHQLASDPTFMHARPICAMPDGRIYAGEMRWRAARELGWKDAPTYIEEVDDTTRRQRMHRDNTHPGDWVPDEVASMLAQARAEDADLVMFGHAEGELDDFLARVADDEGKNPDKPIEPAKKPITRKGDVWDLGGHRLVCGDATRPADVAKAKADLTPKLMVTDPPYGVGLEGWRKAAGLNPLADPRAKEPMSGDEGPGDWSPAWRLSECPVAYVWHGGLHSLTAAASLLSADYELRGQIIWVKNMPPVSRGHYHWLHEPCWYAVAGGKAANWRGGRKQVTVWEAPSPLHIMAGSDEPKTEHPTQKPILLYERAIRNHLGRGEVIYDPFVGSGTAIAAAERTDRVCVALELEPKWVDAAVQRWEVRRARHGAHRVVVAAAGGHRPGGSPRHRGP
jgi:DNA modification methylase